MTENIKKGYETIKINEYGKFIKEGNCYSWKTEFYRINKDSKSYSSSEPYSNKKELFKELRKIFNYQNKFERFKIKLRNFMLRVLK
jgi:hypothetical protein